MTTEEKIITQLINEGKKCLENDQWNEAIDLFSEADTLEKWRDIYGGTILSSLSLAFAQLGNHIKASHFLNQYKEMNQEYGITEEDEMEKI